MTDKADQLWPAISANPANGLATLAELAPGQELSPRDSLGRFITGNNGGGRPRGSKNKLTEAFHSTLKEDFLAHGAEAMAALRASDPLSYLKLVASFVSRDTLIRDEETTDFSSLTPQELGELLDKARVNYSISLELKRFE